MGYLEAKNICKSFEQGIVLSNVSFSLNEGETLSIIGRSGCGKTTLLRALNYLTPIDDGKIYLNDKLILDNTFGKRKKEGDVRANRTHFGLVFQSFNLFPQYTAFENIRLPLFLAEQRRKKEGLPPLTNGNIDEEVISLLGKVGLLDRKDAYPGELSGGQSQRIAIARAMALKPDVLCFDEPTSALDPELSGEVLSLIRELKGKFGITMIIVTHEMSFAREVSDKVMFMKEGRVVEIGKPEEVFASSKPETVAFLSHYALTAN